MSASILPFVAGLDPSLTSFGWSDGELHTIIRTPSTLTLRERCQQIFVQLVQLTETRRHLGERTLWVVEAPLLLTHMDGAQSNLYDRGYLSAHIDDAAESVDAEVLVVPIATLRKFIGKGNIPKNQLPLAVYKKWNVEFLNDPGVDRCVAFALHKYGLAVDAGELEHREMANRGAKRRSA